ncbi:hypothetical protein [Flexivirga sp.]|uniref:hypothetical protein n=1 Tax=Flexivirga sp. TaxID=1962927 RepID=UPI003F7FB955
MSIPSEFAPLRDVCVVIEESPELFEQAPSEYAAAYLLAEAVGDDQFDYHFLYRPGLSAGEREAVAEDVTRRIDGFRAAGPEGPYVWQRGERTPGYYVWVNLTFVEGL